MAHAAVGLELEGFAGCATPQLWPRLLLQVEPLGPVGPGSVGQTERHVVGFSATTARRDGIWAP